MFNVTRPTPAPACLAGKQYNTQAVVDLLEPMFFGKCYLCESDNLTDPEIEHFEPHEGDEAKKFSWDNLYYSCSRCNSIKSNTHRNLLDCCNNTINFTRKIKCTLPSTPSGLIQISAEIDPTDPQTINTIKLLEQCYNATGSPLRGITRSSLIENIYAHYTNLLEPLTQLDNSSILG